MGAAVEPNPAAPYSFVVASIHAARAAEPLR